ncbi:UNVERIFIED_CONTAM: Retrovirus-related Pol polyprotein from transposon RE2 [Sesamum calycinum]|uniref:Retrovirus-related Pol polyprotein from transposon RE2 n=1 Tax=Sesamum calycinum TaxID=2727403 RepID=A0AAW2NHX2_9LAMI
MKEVYAIPDRHTTYVATKEFFKAKMTEGSSMQEHGVKMLSLVEKLEDLKVGLDNDTYINVILQLLPLSYDSFIVNFNMNGLDKSINELINMLQKTLRALPLLQWEWARKRGRRVVSNSRGQTISALIAVRKGIGSISNQGMLVIEVNMITNSASWILDTGCGAHICNDLQVLQRSRKLSKDEVVLRLGDGKATFELLINKNCFYLMKDDSSHLLGKLNNGLYILQKSDWIMTAQNKRKLDNLENAKIWHARLGHISQDRMKSYVYLMRYKFEAFVRFKEFKLEVENQIDRQLECHNLLSGMVFLGMTGQLDNDPKTTEKMSDKGKWLEAMTSKMDSIQVWTDLYGSTRGFTVVGKEQKKKVSGSSDVFLVLYVDDILGTLKHGYPLKMLGDTKAWLSTQFSMKDLDIRRVLGEAYWTVVKIILKYLRRTKDVFLVYGGGELILEGFSDASFQSDDDDAKSQSGFVFKLNASEAAKEAVWIKNYIQELGVVPSIAEPVVILCDNNGAIAQARKPRSHHRSNHILKRYHLLKEMVGRDDIRMDRVSSVENTADPLTKPVSQITHAQHLGKMGALGQVGDY